MRSHPDPGSHRSAAGRAVVRANQADSIVTPFRDWPTANVAEPVRDPLLPLGSGELPATGPNSLAHLDNGTTSEPGL